MGWSGSWIEAVVERCLADGPGTEAYRARAKADLARGAALLGAARAR